MVAMFAGRSLVAVTGRVLVAVTGVHWCSLSCQVVLCLCTVLQASVELWWDVSRRGQRRARTIIYTYNPTRASHHVIAAVHRASPLLYKRSQGAEVITPRSHILRFTSACAFGQTHSLDITPLGCPSHRLCLTDMTAFRLRD